MNTAWVDLLYPLCSEWDKTKWKLVLAYFGWSSFDLCLRCRYLVILLFSLIHPFCPDFTREAGLWLSSLKQSYNLSLLFPCARSCTDIKTEMWMEVQLLLVRNVMLYKLLKLPEAQFLPLLNEIPCVHKVFVRISGRMHMKAANKLSNTMQRWV